MDDADVARAAGGASGRPIGARSASTRTTAGGLHRIVIVGGGAGGLELATRLGDRLGRKRRAHVTLIEKARTHFWKPHLHEIAAGSMDIGLYQTDYLAQSHWHHFRYRVGEATGIDRAPRASSTSRRSSTMAMASRKRSPARVPSRTTRWSSRSAA